jgi:hypothetical protein
MTRTLTGDRRAALTLASGARDGAELRTLLHMTGLLAEGPRPRAGSPVSVAITASSIAGCVVLSLLANNPVGAENACHLGVCAEKAVGSVPARGG